MTTYRGNYVGIGQMLNAPWMQKAMHDLAEQAKAIAITTAPFDAADADGEHYKDAFDVTSGTHGGVRHDRAYGRLTNNNTAAWNEDRRFSVALAVEFGSHNRPASHTVRNALQAAARGET